MPASLFTAASTALAGALASMRKDAKLTQRQLAAALGREQNLVARVEQAQRRVDLVELIQWIRACGLDPGAEIPRLAADIAALVPQKRRTRPH